MIFKLFRSTFDDPRSTRYKVIILDFDGVLVESTDIKEQAFAEVFKDFPEFKDSIDQYLKDHQALIRFKKFQHIYEQILKKPYTDAVEQKLAEQFSGFVIDRVIHCPAVAGADDFLKYFYTKTPLYIVSINPAVDLKIILNGRRWSHYFKKVYAVDESKARYLHEIVKQEKVDLSEAVFIGDSVSDFHDAQEAEIPFIPRERDQSWEGFKGPVFKNLLEIKNYLIEGKDS